MITEKIYDKLVALGVSITVEREQLRVRAPKGVLSVEDRKLLLDHKEDLIEFLRKDTSDGPLDIQVVPRPEQENESFPLTEVQEAYWMGRRPDFDLGNVGAQVFLELEGSGLCPQRLQEAWNVMLKRHGMLRAVVDIDGTQKVLHETPSYEIKVIDLQDCDDDQIANGLEKDRERMKQEILPADRWPLFEIRFFHLPQGLHRLFFKYDSLILDAQSQEILFREWGMLYENPGKNLRDLDLSFRDFVIADEIRRRGSRGRKRAEAYWDSLVPTLPPAPDLPLAAQSSTIKHPSFGNLDAFLDQDVWSKLRSKARQHGLTESGLLVATFSEILKVWSQSDDFTLNLTLFNRHSLHPQVDEIIGDFSSLILLQIPKIEGKHTFLERAKVVQEQLWNNIEHSEVSGIEVQRKLSNHEGRTVNFPVVFTSTLSHSNAEEDEAARRWIGKDISYSYPTPQVSLDYVVSEEKGVLKISWNFVEDLFHPGYLEEMLTSYIEFLRELASDPIPWEDDLHRTARRLLGGRWIGKLDSIGETAKSFTDGESLLHELFEKSARTQPSRVALTGSFGKMSYAELDERANTVAAKIVGNGSRAGKLVAVVMERGWEQVVAVLGILKAGFAYLPIDSSVPPERLEFLLKIAGSSYVLTQTKFREKLSIPNDISCLVIDDAMTPVEVKVQPRKDPDDLAYVIFTSGSTGEPKGVQISHRAVVNTILDINDRFAISRSDKILALSSLSFDLSVYDIFGVLAAGGEVVLPDATESRNPTHWLDLIEKEGVTLWNTVPALMQLMVDRHEIQPNGQLDSLRLVLLSGDWIPVDLPNRLQKAIKGGEVVSLGGATEASIWSIYYPIKTVDLEWESIPYGFALTNQSMFVMSDKMNLCPPWVAGEILIGGVGLSSGYWADEALTTAKYIRHPLTGERLYRTGDKGRYHPDGYIEFLGRADDQVKIRGYRVEPGEIESALMKRDEIDQAVVIAIKRSADHNARLLAFVTPKLDAESREKALSFLKDRLPDYMIPEQIMSLASFPLSSNGKVDRKALSRVEPYSTGGGNLAMEERTPLEKYLIETWEALLHVKGIGINDNFFRLGGNSIDVANLVNRLQKRYGKVFNIGSVFRAPTIADLSRKLTADYPSVFSKTPKTELGSFTLSDLDRFQIEIRYPEVAASPSRKNPKAVFILSAPRSGSTLLRVMLQGHPDLFAPPELFLLPYDTISEQSKAFPGYRKSALEGNIRALMEARHCSAEEATALRDSLELAGTSTQEFYERLQLDIGSKTLVEKTQTYAVSLDTLRRAEDWFKDVQFIHLVRHPYGMISSFEEATMAADIYAHLTHGFDTESGCPYPQRQLAAMLWHLENQNILSFLKGIPTERSYQVTFEDLVSSPEKIIDELCQFLDIHPSEQMMNPYGDPKIRMVNGIHKASRMQGDAKFQNHQRIDPAVANRWIGSVPAGEIFPSETWELAARFGYRASVETREEGTI